MHDAQIVAATVAVIVALAYLVPATVIAFYALVWPGSGHTLWTAVATGLSWPACVLAKR